MVNQAQVDGKKTNASPAAGVGHNVADLSHDLIELAELQCQLLLVDVSESKSKSMIPVIVMAGAALFALGTIPVILLGVGWLLVDTLDLSEAAAFLIVGFVSLLIAAGAGWWGYRAVKSALSLLTRSRREMSENIRWIKMALKSRGTHAARHAPLPR